MKAGIEHEPKEEEFVVFAHLNHKDGIDTDTCLPCIHGMVIIPLTNVSNIFAQEEN